MKIIVTGADGFIGQHVCNSLKEIHEVLGIDYQDKNKSNLIRFIGKDLIGNSDVEDAFKEFKPDVVVHLASTVSNEIDDCEFDYVVMLQVLKLSLKYEVKKFIFSSSAAVYGDSYPKTIPINPYGITKLQCEQWADYYSEKGLKVFILRFANVYGPNGRGIINSWIDSIKENKPLKINGDGTQVRDYIHVEDIVKTIIKIIEFGYNSDVINVSTGDCTSVLELLSMFSKYKKELTIEFDLNTDVGIKHSVLPTTATTRTPLSEGIKKLFEGKE